MPDPYHDLHSHTTASDGWLTPEELVDLAARRGVQVLAITDHDTTAGVGPARLAAPAGLRVVSGVEVSAQWDGIDVHVVGLGVNPGHATLASGLRTQRTRRAERAAEIARRLHEAAGVAATVVLEGAARPDSVGRGHFARFLVTRGMARDNQDAFKRYLGPRGTAYVPGVWVDLATAVAWIQEAGGLAVLAHPGRYALKTTRLEALCRAFADCGGDALEVVNGPARRSEVRALARLSHRYGLAASLGSDFHGPVSGPVLPGRTPPLPRGCIPVWRHGRWPHGATAHDDSRPADGVAHEPIL